MALFGTFWPYLLLEPFGLYLSVLHVKRMCLFHPFEKIVKVLLPKNHPSVVIILGHFPGFSSDDHLDICFSDQQGLTEFPLVLYLLR